MGDVGSGYIGYFLSVLAIAAARYDSVAIWVWLVLGGVFFVDSTVTLVRRDSEVSGSIRHTAVTRISGSRVGGVATGRLRSRSRF